MDHKREHRTPPLARVMGVGRQQQHYYFCISSHGSEVKYDSSYFIIIVDNSLDTKNNDGQASSVFSKVENVCGFDPHCRKRFSETLNVTIWAIN